MLPEAWTCQHPIANNTTCHSRAVNSGKMTSVVPLATLFERRVALRAGPAQLAYAHFLLLVLLDHSFIRSPCWCYFLRPHHGFCAQHAAALRRHGRDEGNLLEPIPQRPYVHVHPRPRRHAGPLPLQQPPHMPVLSTAKWCSVVGPRRGNGAPFSRSRPLCSSSTTCDPFTLSTRNVCTSFCCSRCVAALAQNQPASKPPFLNDSMPPLPTSNQIRLWAVHHNAPCNQISWGPPMLEWRMNPPEQLPRTSAAACPRNQLQAGARLHIPGCWREMSPRRWGPCSSRGLWPPLQGASEARPQEAPTAAGGGYKMRPTQVAAPQRQGRLRPATLPEM
jgi:hypothetical protein